MSEDFFDKNRRELPPSTDPQAAAAARRRREKKYLLTLRIQSETVFLAMLERVPDA